MKCYIQVYQIFKHSPCEAKIMQNFASKKLVYFILDNFKLSIFNYEELLNTKNIFFLC